MSPILNTDVVDEIQSKQEEIMKNMSLIDIFEKFPTEEDAVLFLEKIRWDDQVVSPYCKSDKTCFHKELDFGHSIYSFNFH